MTEELIKSHQHSHHRLVGQLYKLEKMVNEKQSPEKIYIQYLAAQGALKSIIEKSFSDIISQNLIQGIDNYLTQNKTDTPYIRHLIHIRKNLFSYNLKHRIQFLSELKKMH